MEKKKQKEKRPVTLRGFFYPYEDNLWMNLFSCCFQLMGKLVLQLQWRFMHFVVSSWYFVVGIANVLESYDISSGLLISFFHLTGNFVLQILWRFMHLIVSLWFFVVDIADVLESYVISSGLLVKFKNLDLTNLPYLAIVIDSDEAHNTSRVVELLRWCLHLNVRGVCLYDTDGVLKKSKERILDTLGDVRLWKETNDSSPDQKKMTLEFVSFSDGRDGIVRAANFLCSKYKKFAGLDKDDIQPVFTEAELDLVLKAVGYGRPEPDLLLIYGHARCHSGFPAWRLQYTEIVNMGPLKSMRLGCIIKAIHKFSSVHQNYGS